MSVADAQELFDQAKHVVEGEDEALLDPKTPRFHDPVTKALDILDDAMGVLDRENDASEEANILRGKIDVMRRTLIDEMVE